jgi:isopenicillin-N epimerase
MQMIALPMPQCDAEKLKTRLYDEWHIEVPIIAWQNQLLIRVSIQAYNTLEDVEQLLDALKQSSSL